MALSLAIWLLVNDANWAALTAPICVLLKPLMTVVGNAAICAVLSLLNVEVDKLNRLLEEMADSCAVVIACNWDWLKVLSCAVLRLPISAVGNVAIWVLLRLVVWAVVSTLNCAVLKAFSCVPLRLLI